MNLPNVIGIAGQQGSGKDTAAKWFIERGYGRSGFADPLKWMLNQAFGWSMFDWEDREWKERESTCMCVCPSRTDVQKISPRRLAQWLGTEVVRNNFGNDAWVNMWKQRWHDTGQPKVVVPDVRFQNEIAAIHKLGGVVIRITRKGDTSAKVYMHDGEVEHVPHESERTDGLWEIDHEIANDGTIQDLHDKLARYAGGEKAA